MRNIKLITRLQILLHVAAEDVREARDAFTRQCAQGEAIGYRNQLRALGAVA